MSDNSADILDTAKVRVSSRTELTLRDICRSWQRSVELLKRSVSGDPVVNEDVFNEHDYIGALYMRGFLVKALAEVGEPIPTRVREAFEPIDTDFVEITDSGFSRQVAVVAFDDQGEGWWWDRAPKAGIIREAIDEI